MRNTACKKPRRPPPLYVQQVTQAHQGALDYLARLGELTAGVILPAEPTASAENPFANLTIPDPVEEKEPAPVAAGSAPVDSDPDLDATRRFEDLQFGKDYEIT